MVQAEAHRVAMELEVLEFVGASPELAEAEQESEGWAMGQGAWVRA